MYLDVSICCHLLIIPVIIIIKKLDELLMSLRSNVSTLIPGALCWESMTRISAVNASSRKIAATMREAGIWTETAK